MSKNCVWSDSMVITPDGEKMIKYIDPGEQILTSSGFTEVLEIGINPIRPVIWLYINDNLNIILTEDQEIKTTNGWVLATELSIGDIIYSTDNGTTIEVEVTGIDIQQTGDNNVNVDMILDNSDEFFANNILVRNC